MDLARGRAGRLPLTMITLSLVALAGCGGDTGRDETVPAGGTVTYKGRPLDHGFVQFVPDQGRAAYGTIGSDGRFAMTTYDVEGDGVIPGAHKVAVVVTEDKPGKPGQDAITRYVVPQKYSDPTTSNIVVEVPPEGKTDIAIAVD